MVFGQKDGEIDRKSACKRQEAICIVLPQDFTIKRIDPPKPPKNAKIMAFLKINFRHTGRFF